jgi:hypothetical protein
MIVIDSRRSCRRRDQRSGRSDVTVADSIQVSGDVILRAERNQERPDQENRRASFAYEFDMQH